MDYRPFQGWVLSHPPLLTQNTVVSLYSFLVTRGMIARTSRRFSILVKRRHKRRALNRFKRSEPRDARSGSRLYVQLDRLFQSLCGVVYNVNNTSRETAD